MFIAPSSPFVEQSDGAKERLSHPNTSPCAPFHFSVGTALEGRKEKEKMQELYHWAKVHEHELIKLALEETHVNRTTLLCRSSKCPQLARYTTPLTPWSTIQIKLCLVLKLNLCFSFHTEMPNSCHHHWLTQSSSIRTVVRYSHLFPPQLSPLCDTQLKSASVVNQIRQCFSRMTHANQCQWCDCWLLLGCFAKKTSQTERRRRSSVLACYHSVSTSLPLLPAASSRFAQLSLVHLFHC